MRKTLFLTILVSFFACSGGGIEGYVGESISITADNPEEGKDVDYNWTLANQPDGSLMNSTDLSASDDGQKMSFIPDYPGDYSVEVVVSQYGDDIANQTFSFSIIDPKNQEEKVEDEESKDEVNEEWLNEDLEKESDVVIEDEDEESDDSDYDDEVEDDADSDDQENEVSDEDDNNIPVTKNISSAGVQAKAIQPKKGASIAAKTDQFTIQITSKRMLSDAQLFSQKMISKGYDAYIQKALFDTDKIWYRVRVGSYDNYNSAKAAADVLSEELGMTTWVDFVRKE
jgi:septal ring-binding cell division protein DamX